MSRLARIEGSNLGTMETFDLLMLFVATAVLLKMRKLSKIKSIATADVNKVQETT
jgi:hypothetical protein